MKESLLGKTPDELREVALKVGLPAFAGKQLAGWLYGRRVKSFDEMTNISKVGRERLAEEFDLGVVTPSSCQVSKDGTKKYWFPLGVIRPTSALSLRRTRVLSPVSFKSRISFKFLIPHRSCLIASCASGSG